MMRLALYIGLCLSLALAWISPSPLLAQAGTDGVVQGQLINKSPQGQGVADIPVELKTLKEGTETASVAAPTDAQGKFRFSGISTQPTYSYQVVVIYQEAEYTSSDITFGPGETNKSLEMAVWEGTATDPGLRAAAAHVIVQFEGEENLKITEYYALVNPGDKTYVGSRIIPSLNRKETLRFSLPQAAQMQHLELGLMDCCVAYDNGTLVDTMDIKPGNREIAFTYMVKLPRGGYTLPIVANYPTDTLNLVIQDRGARISSPELSFLQSVNIGSTPFVVWGKDNIQRGEVIQAILSSPSQTSPPPSLRWVGIGLILAALGFGLAYPLVRRRLSPVKEVAQDERRQLLHDVALLDETFESGQMEATQYQQQRAQKMARLIELSRESGQT